MCCELSKSGVLVQWKKGAVLLRPGDKYDLKQEGCKLQLKIHDVNRLDSGNYKCCAGGLVTTASVTVKGMTNPWVTYANSLNIYVYMYVYTYMCVCVCL